MVSDKDISLGEFLRQEREHKCITIEQVASATKVGVRTLHSLEENHYAELPAKPFIRGFVTSYCRFIGLDAKEVLSRFDDYINKKSIERPNREAGHSGYAFEKKDGEQQGRTILFIAIFSFIVIGGLAMIFLKPSLRHHRGSHIDKLRAAHVNVEVSPSPLVSPGPSSSVLPISGAVAVNAGAPVPLVSSRPSPVPSPSHSADQEDEAAPDAASKVPGANPADPLDSGLALKSEEIQQKVTFKMMSDTWVRYQVDDRPVRKFIVRKGKVLILRGKEKVQFQASNPDQVSFSYKGHGFVPLSGNKNAVVRQGDTTVFFPHDLSEKIEKPFGNGRALPRVIESKAESLTPVSEPSP